MKKQYKALMLDLDGTTIPNEVKGLPNEKVIAAIAKAREKLHVGFITGRPYVYTKDIRKHLLLTRPSIASGGAQIFDVGTDKILWQKFIPQNEIGDILHKLSKYNNKILIQDKRSDTVFELNEKRATKDVLSIAMMDIAPDQIESVVNDLKDFPSIAAHKIVGWKKGTYWIQISHVEATKQHGIAEVAKLLGIHTKEIIGVGDGYNDFPLLMACGLRVAMGNAVPELKKIADYVAPSVDEDGVADVIEKFVL